MNLLKRIKNLWELSELEPMKIGERPQIGDTVTALKKAVIIKKDTSVEDFLHEN